MAHSVKMRNLASHGHYPKRPLAVTIQRSRLLILGCIALVAHFASVLGINNNLVQLSLAVCAVILVWPAITALRPLYFLFLALIGALLLGIFLNDTISALRSAIPYFGLLVACGLFSQQLSSTSTKINESVALLYAAGIIQLTTYLVQVVGSPDYFFIFSLDEFNRFGVGWISVVCFFHALLPSRKKLGLSRILRHIGIIFWIVPLLIAFNSSRSELLMLMLLTSISLCLSRPFIFTVVVVVATVALSVFTYDLPVLGRVNRSLEEAFKGDIETLSEVHHNYRAFENLMMFERILSSGPIGCGLGCGVPLPFTMTLEEQEYDEIAVFHNGALTFVLHFGLLGLLIIFSLLWQLWKTGRSFVIFYFRRDAAGTAAVQPTALRFAVLLLLVGTSVTTGGFMSSQDMLVLLLPLSTAVGILPKSRQVETPSVKK
jgi:hypothetical protein